MRYKILIFVILFPILLFGKKATYYSYVSDFIDCLANLNACSTQFENNEVRFNSNENPFLLLISAIDKQIELIIESKLLIKPYININDSIVASSSKTTYEILAEIHRLSIIQKQNLLKYSENTISSDQCFNQIFKNQELIKQQYGILFFNSVLYTHAIVSPIPDKDGLLSYLRFSYSERYRLISKIDNIFGEDITNEPTVGMSYILGCASNIRNILSGEHKSRK